MQTDELTVRERIRELLAERVDFDRSDLLQRADGHEREAERHAELAWLYALLGDHRRAEDHLESARNNSRWARESRQDAAEGRRAMSVGPVYLGKNGKRSVARVWIAARLPRAPRRLPTPRVRSHRRLSRRAPSSRRRRSGLVRGARSPGRLRDEPEPESDVGPGCRRRAAA